MSMARSNCHGPRLNGLYESGPIDLVRAGHHDSWLRHCYSEAMTEIIDDAQSVMDAIGSSAQPILDSCCTTSHLLRLRTLMARARGDEAGYRDLRRPLPQDGRIDLGFEGHMAWAKAMP